MNWKNKKVLVTGADGFIGSHLTEALVKKGAEVKAFAYYNSFNSWGWMDTFSPSVKKKIDVFTGDIRDPNGVFEAVHGCDVVFHLAALIGIPFSYHSPDSYVDTNVKGTLNILQAAKKCKVQKVVHTSTSEVYGTAQYAPIDELHPINPQSPYAATKAGADSLAQSFYLSFDLPVTTLRPFNTFGPRQSARAVIPTIISQIVAGKKTIKLGNIDALRDLNYVGNTAEAFIAVAEEPKTNGQVLNTGSGVEVSIKEVVERVQKVLGKKVRVVVDKERIRPSKSEVGRLLCDANKLVDYCDWTPKVNLDQGLKLTADWIVDNMNYFKTDIYNV